MQYDVFTVNLPQSFTTAAAAARRAVTIQHSVLMTSDTATGLDTCTASASDVAASASDVAAAAAAAATATISILVPE